MARIGYFFIKNHLFKENNFGVILSIYHIMPNIE